MYISFYKMFLCVYICMYVYIYIYIHIYIYIYVLESTCALRAHLILLPAAQDCHQPRDLQVCLLRFLMQCSCPYLFVSASL